MELKDVLHFYIGTEMLCAGSDILEEHEYTYILSMITIHDAMVMNHKPILRKLSSMTKEEARAGDIFKWHHSGDDDLNRFSSKQFHYLLSNGFDLFNLIDSNQAIEQK